jgi:hypothetical protein
MSSKKAQKCSNCKKMGHNKRTCKEPKRMNEEEDDEEYKCSVCNQHTDHDELDCPNKVKKEEFEEKKKIRKKKCKICKEFVDHNEFDCPLNTNEHFEKEKDDDDEEENTSSALSNSESEGNLIPRRDHLRKKKGNKKNGTDGAHILSFQVMDAIVLHVQILTRQELYRISDFLNQSFNIRIKSVRGNRSLDKKLDNEIIAAFSSGSTLSTPAFDRARRQARILFRAQGKMKDIVVQTALDMFEKLKNRTGKSVLEDLEKDIGSDEEVPNFPIRYKRESMQNQKQQVEV